MTSLFGGGALHLAYHRALPRLLSVTESIALPPRPKGGRYVQYLQFSVREWLVPPVLLPIFFGLLIAAAVLIQW
jgi:hypothetical protein